MPALRDIIDAMLKRRLANPEQALLTQLASVTPPWTLQTPAYQNGWVDYDTNLYGPVRYWKDCTGHVHIEGLVKSGTAGTTVFNLPSGYRPRTQQVFNTWSNGVATRIDVTTGGDVTHDGAGNSYVTLCGISFLAQN